MAAKPTFSATIIGTTELSKALRYIGKEYQAEFMKEYRRVARTTIVPAVRQQAPVRTGAMRRNIYITLTQRRGLKLNIGRRGKGNYSQAWYAPFVLRGTKHMSANWFPYRALHAVMPKVTTDLQNVVNRHMAVFARKLNNRQDLR